MEKLEKSELEKIINHFKKNKWNYLLYGTTAGVIASNHIGLDIPPYIKEPSKIKYITDGIMLFFSGIYSLSLLSEYISNKKRKKFDRWARSYAKKYGLEKLLETCKSEYLKYEFAEWYYNFKDIRKNFKDLREEKSLTKVPKIFRSTKIYEEPPKYLEGKIMKDDFGKISLKKSETLPEDAAKFRGYPFEITQFCIRCGHDKAYIYIPLEDESNKNIAYKCSGCNCISYFTKKYLKK